VQAEFARCGETAEGDAVGGLRKRSLQLSGHATSIALEPEFWAVLEAMAGAEQVSLAALIARLDAERAGRPLASACRVAALAYATVRAGSGGPSGAG
jgi:predicted DNA-binding ribbon-helix-helix protein